MRASISWRIAAFVLAIAACWPGSARADGKRDLDDGIAFYENLDTERALERLKAASEARDLGAGDRAKAFLYLGLVQFESGDRGAATESWKRSVALDKNVAIPQGTSPKAVEAISAVRGGAKAQKPPTTEPGGAKTDTPKGGATSATKGGGAKSGTSVEPATTPKLGAVTDTPDIATEQKTSEGLAPGEATKPDLTAKTPAPAKDDDGVPTWLLVGGIGAVAVGAVVVTVLLLGSGSSTGDCKEGGGCLTVTFQ